MLVCAKCGQENPESARFCNACAAALETTAKTHDWVGRTREFDRAVSRRLYGDVLTVEDVVREVRTRAPRRAAGAPRRAAGAVAAPLRAMRRPAEALPGQA